MLISSPMLAHYGQKLPIILTVDSSSYALYVQSYRTFILTNQKDLLHMHHEYYQTVNANFHKSKKKV